MKRKTKKSLEARRRIVAYLDGLQAKVNALWEEDLLRSNQPAENVGQACGFTLCRVLREGKENGVFWYR